MSVETIEPMSNDFSRFIVNDTAERLKPIHKLIDDMHTRLEEFQTMVNFARQERATATNILTSLHSSQKNLADLFLRIDTIENLIEHVKCTLCVLEKDMQKTEEEIGYSESTSIKVANIFTPLFKKNLEKKDQSIRSLDYQTSDFFYTSDTEPTDEFEIKPK